jgi:hypothetical protein
LEIERKFTLYYNFSKEFIEALDGKKLRDGTTARKWLDNLFDCHTKCHDDDFINVHRRKEQNEVMRKQWHDEWEQCMNLGLGTNVDAFLRQHHILPPKEYSADHAHAVKHGHVDYHKIAALY